jgi:hypothetical protein
MITSLAAQEQQQVAAKVVRIKGIARYTTGNNIWQPLKVGALVKAGTVIQTGIEKESYVDVVLGEGEGAATPIAYNPAPSLSAPSAASAPSYQGKAKQSIIRIFDNTVVGIDKLTSLQTGAEEVTDTELDLKLGHVFFNVKKLSAASKFEIKLPNGVAGIRGTCGEVWAVGKIAVEAGAVVVSFVNSKTGEIKTETVEAGKFFDFQDFANTTLRDLTRREQAWFRDIINQAAREANINPGRISVPVNTTIVPVSAH